MKKFLSLLFALSAFLAQGQNIRRIIIAPPSGSSGAYEVRAPRDLSLYPLTTSGTSSFTAALASGTFSLTTTGGCIIAKGTPPPVTAPTCTPVETTPSWITGLRYSHDGTTMTVLASGDVSSIAFNTNPVTSWSIPNPNNVMITNGVFYGHAPDAVNGFYSWQINKPAGAFTLTLKNSSGNTYSKNFSATTWANNVVLIGTTTDPPTTTVTYRPISKVLIESNSIGFYPTNVGFGWSGNWGAAASAANKDFYHILSDSIHTIYPNADVRLWGMNNEAGISIAEGGYFEQAYDNLGDGLHRYDTLSQYAPDVLITRLGENVTEVRSTFQDSWKNQINRVTIHSTNPLKIITTSVWGNSTVDNALITLANNNGWPLVDLRNIAGSRDGTVNHPTDAAHAEYAKRIWAKMKTSLAISTTTTTPPSTTTSVSPVTAYYANGFGEGSVDQLFQSAPFVPSNNQLSSWNYATDRIQFLDNGRIRFGIGKSIGGAIQWLGLSGGGKNWINTNNEAGQSDYEGIRSPDTGRSAGWSMYGTPGPWIQNGRSNGYFGENGYWSKDSGYDTGYNIVQGGSNFGDRSEIQFFERRTVAGYGEVLYCRTRARMWDIQNEYGRTTLHCFWWLEGNAVRYYSIVDNQRTDNQMKYEGSQQEGPFVYSTADLYNHFIYEGNQPGNAGTGYNGLSQINKPVGERGFYEIHNASEGWIASLNNSGNGVILMPLHNSRFMGGQFNEWDGNQDSNASSYVNSAQMMNYDVRQSTAFGGYLFAWDINNFRNWYNTNQSNIKRPEFSWSFGTNNTCGWWSGNAPARFVNNRYSITIGKRANDPGDPSGGTIFRANAAFASPYGIWKASDINGVYVKAKFGGQTNYRLSWKKSGHDNNAEFSKTFNVSSTQDEQTVFIPLSSGDNWNDYIVNIKIGLADNMQGTNGNEEFVPSYIGKNNPAQNALGDFSTLLLLSIGAGTALQRRRKVTAVRTQKPTPRLRLGVGTLAALLLTLSIFSCQSAVTIRKSKQAVTEPRVLIYDLDDAYPSPVTEPHASWSMYGTPSGKLRLDSLYETNYDPIHSGSVPDSLRHKDH